MNHDTTNINITTAHKYNNETFSIETLTVSITSKFSSMILFIIMFHLIIICIDITIPIHKWMERIKLQIIILLCTSLQISNYSYLDLSTATLNNNMNDAILFNVENDLTSKPTTTDDIYDIQILLTFSTTVYMTIFLSIINSCIFAIQKRNQHRYRHHNNIFHCNIAHNNIFQSTHQQNIQKKSTKNWGYIMRKTASWLTCCSFVSFLCNLWYIFFFHVLVNQNNEKEIITTMIVIPITWVKMNYLNATKNDMITPNTINDTLANGPFQNDLYPWHLFTIWNYFKTLAIFILGTFMWTIVYYLKAQQQQRVQNHDLYYWNQNNTGSSFFSFLRIPCFWRPYHRQTQSYIANGILGDPNNRNSIKECDWYKWDSEAVLIWIGMQHEKQQQKQYDAARIFDIANLLQTLSFENINGKCLESITLTDLRSFGLSYGDAFWCKQQMHDLISDYDRFGRRYVEFNKTSDPSFDGKDNEFVNSIDNIVSQSMLCHTEDDIDVGQINEIAISKAKEIMSERFGLSLPEMKTDALGNKSQEKHHKKNEDQNNNEPNLKDPPGHAMIENRLLRGAARKNPDHNINVADESLPIPSEIYNSMLPNIQEIVRNRPDLVRQAIDTTRNKLNPNHLKLRQFHQPQPQPQLKHRQHHSARKNLDTIDESSFYEKKTNTLYEKKQAVTTAASKTNTHLSNITNDASQIPTHIFNSMPTNIQDIVRNRPDLLQQVLNARNRNTNEAQSSSMHKDIESNTSLKKQSEQFSKSSPNYNNNKERVHSHQTFNTSHRKPYSSHLKNNHLLQSFKEDNLKGISKHLTRPNDDDDNQGEDVNLLTKM